MAVKENDTLFQAWNLIGAFEPTLRAVTFDEDAEQHSPFEVEEIMQYLPDFKDKVVLDMAAGIGRFTQEFAKEAKSVTAVDFSQGFIDKNKEVTAEFGNVECICADAVEWDYPQEHFDFVFCNWLMMYLDDDYVELTLPKIVNSIKPGGKVFFRESCNTTARGQFDDAKEHPIQPVREIVSNTRYRSPEYYQELFKKSGLNLLSSGNIKIFEKRFDNQNQLFWLLEKTS